MQREPYNAEGYEKASHLRINSANHPRKFHVSRYVSRYVATKNVSDAFISGRVLW